MRIYRLTRPLVGLPFGQKEPITIPAGTIVEHDGFLQSAGLTVAIVDGKRTTVMCQDFLNCSQANCETGFPA